jgi:hypothetical protein
MFCLIRSALDNLNRKLNSFADLFFATATVRSTNNATQIVYVFINCAHNNGKLHSIIVLVTCIVK